ncbi:MAG: hypothetical protein QW727_00660 [Candidatus Pacearchaeota archaeon]
MKEGDKMKESNIWVVVLVSVVVAFIVSVVLILAFIFWEKGILFMDNIKEPEIGSFDVCEDSMED